MATSVSFLTKIEMSEVNPDEVTKNVQEAIARLVEARKELGLSQYRVAQLTGLSRESIRLIESGRRFPSLRNFLLLCTALELDPAKALESRHK